ncbi:hypothetical protein QJR26_09610 [Clostridium baratii]
MKKKLIIGYVGILAIGILIGIGIKNKNQKIEEEKYLKEESTKIELTEEEKKEKMKIGMSGSEEWEDKYNQSQNNYFDFTKEEVVQTRDMGIKFLKYAREYDYDRGISKETANEIKKLTTKGLGDELADRLKHLRPAPVVRFRRMEVNLAEPIQYKKYEDGTVNWEYGILEHAINDSGEVAKEIQSRVSLLFVKDNNQWKIGEYSVSE